ncbi:MAG: T9SS type A sorting domain-containing protein [Bacteroidetes bacterium]|nr:T9SS type A sorting domain-containing protein [Bacteroidota bacterium]
MKKLLLPFFVLFWTVCFFVQPAQADIVVTVTNNTNTTPNLAVSYTSLASALNALNAVTAMTGPVTLVLAAGSSETAPIKGLTIGSASLNAALSATNSVTIVKAGGTVTLNAGIGTATPASASPDGILKIVGADYITIDGLTLTDGNTSNPATMEFGIALFKLSLSDGARYNTIQNCTFNMKRINNATGTAPMVEGSVGILVINATPTAAVTSLVPTTAAGTNSYNKFYANTLNDGNYGIALSGYAAATPFTAGDTGNDIGGSSALTGNTILNFGGASAATNPAAGIRANNQWGINISYNTINNNNGSGVNHPNTLRGIYGQAGTSASATINYNSVTLKGGGTTTALDCIYNGIGMTSAGNTITMAGNTVENCTYSTATTGTFTGVYNGAYAETVNMYGNTVKNNTIAGSGTFYGINGTSSTNLNIYSNTMFGNTKSVGTSYATMYCIYLSSYIQNCHDNLVYTNNINATGGGSGSTLYGFYQNGSETSESFYNNQVYDLNITGPTTNQVASLYGYYCYSGVTSVKNIYQNNFHDFNITTTGGGSIYGMLSYNGTSVNCFGNKMCSFNATGVGGMAIGISLDATTVNIYNNLVGNLFTPNSSKDLSIYGINLKVQTNGNIYYNTVYLNATSTSSLFGSAALYRNNWGSLDLRNNVLVNTSTPKGTGITAAFRSYNPLTMNYYAVSSNNNYYFAGVPSASNVIFYDETTVYSTLANFQALVTPRDNLSLTDAAGPSFLSTSCSDANFLHLSATASVIESGGYPIQGYTTDVDNNIRQGNPGFPSQVNGGGFAPDMGADEYDGIPNNSCIAPAAGNTLASVSNICLGQDITLSLQNPTAGTGVTYQWQQSADGLVYSNIPGAMMATYTTTPASATFFKCIVTCQNGPASATSAPTHITFVNSILTTTPDTICGYGILDLAASAGTGTLNWYSSPMGGSALGTGPAFTTPVLHTTTSYYVATEIVGAISSVGPTTNSIGAGSSTQSSDCMIFDVLTPVKFQGLYVYPGAAGNVVFKITDKYSNVLQTITYPVTALNVNLKTYIPVNTFIPVGTGYRINMSSGTVNLYLNSAGAVYPYTSPGVISITGNSASASYSAYYFYYYDWQVNPSCSSARAEVAATVLPAPELTVSPNQTMCNNEVATLNVTSPLSNFDTYVWSPVTSLFTDNACTIPYDGVSSATTLFVKSGAAITTTYSCTANKSSSGCIATVQTVITVLPSRPTINATHEELCVSGSSVITTSPASGWGAATFQWQNSPDNSIFTDIPGATSLSYSTPILTSTTFYKLKISNSAGSLCMELQRTITVNNPQLTSTTNGSRCNTGSVELQATGTDGDLKWYASLTGWLSIGTGSPFNTPSIGATTSFYVDSETYLNGTVNIGAGILSNSYTPNPFYHFYGGSKMQYLVSASELHSAGLTAGNLTSLSFEFVGDAGQTYNSFNLSMGHTTLTALTTVFQSSLTSVYSAASVTPTSGIYTIPFSIPFAWNGISNLIIETCWSNNNTGGNYVYVKYDNTAYASVSYYRANSMTAQTLCATSTGGGTYTTRPRMIFDGQVLCTSPRSEVIATVIPPPDLAITASQTICVGEVYQMGVNTPVSNFDTYTWNPATNLFSDADCNVAYLPLSNASTVYVKSAVASSITYICTATHLASNCINTAQANIVVLPQSAAISASQTVLCMNGSAVLSLSPAIGWGTATFQWRSSPGNLVFTDIPGATDMNYTTPSISATTYYQLGIKNGAGTECATPQFTLIVENPQVTSTTQGSRCGPGTVSLQATIGGGGVLKWYSSPTSSVSLGTGSPFVTPVISSTTTYYAAAAGSASVNEITGQTYVSHSYSTCFTNYGIVFSTTRDIVINSTTVYTSGAGTVTIALLNSSGTEIAVTSPIAVSGPGYTLNILNLGFYVPVGTNYKLVMKAFTGFTTMFFEPANYSYFPYISTSGAVSITSGWKNSATSTSNYWFYRLDITTGCVSSRTPVLASITAPPAITPSATATGICAGFSSTLNVTSSNPDYTYVWTPGNMNGATQTVSPETTTTYTVTASVPGASCTTTGTVTVTVLASPSPVNITPPGPVIVSGDVQQLTATGGIVPNNSILDQNFNSASNNWTTINNSTGGTPASAAWTLRPNGYVYASYGTWHSNDNTQFYMSNSEAQGPGGTTATTLQSPSFSTSGFISATLGFYFCFYEISSGTSTGKAEASTDGATWTTLTTYNSNTGAPGAFSHAAIALTAPFLNQPVVYIRFKYDAAYRYFWGIDNVSLTGTLQANITWSPLTDLYTDDLATTSYTGQSLANVYSKPPGTITYTASATLPSTGCVKANTVTITVTTAPLNLNATTGDVSGCFGYSNGSVSISVNGGVTPYGYLWNNGETSGSIAGLSAGSYSVTVTDAAMSAVSGSWTVSQPPDLALSAQPVNANCPTGSDGGITLTVSGGTPGYTYLWSNTATDQNITGLQVGTYTVTISDGNGCSKTGSWLVGAANPICDYKLVTGSSPGKACYDALLTITVAGGGATFNEAMPGDSATFIAGMNILFEPGTQIDSGAYMHGYISTSFCSPTDKQFVSAADGLNEPAVIPSGSHFAIYPNPTSGNFTLVQKGDIVYGTLKMEVYPMNGRKIMTEQMIGEKSHEFRFSGIPAGLYFVKVVADDYVETIKLVKTR